MPKLRAVQPTPPGLAMSYVPDPRIIDGDQITPRRRDGPFKPGEDPTMVKEGSTGHANSLYYHKLIQQWLHKGDVKRWTGEVAKWAVRARRNAPYFFNKDCQPGEEDYKAPWTLKIPTDALQVSGRRIVEEGSVQIIAEGRDNITYEVARCPLWEAIQLLQHHKFLKSGAEAEEVIQTFAPDGLRSPSSSSYSFYDESPDYPEEYVEDDDYDEDYEEDED